jgi:hypothetical protein
VPDVAVELFPIRVEVQESGTFISDLGTGDEREFAWLIVDMMKSVETIELASELFSGDHTIRAVFETYIPLATDADKYVMEHWGHPMVQCLISRKPQATDRILNALAFHLCARCESTLFQALTGNNTMTIAGAMSCEYDSDDENTWPTFMTVRTNVNQIQQVELVAWRNAYKQHAHEGEQLTIHSAAE